MWHIASEDVKTIVAVKGSHHPEWLKTYEENSERHKEMEKVIEFWIAFFNEKGFLPPGLATKCGNVIDGNHRYAAVQRLKNVTWWCQGVVPIEHWVATAQLILIES